MNNYYPGLGNFDQFIAHRSFTCNLKARKEIRGLGFPSLYFAEGIPYVVVIYVSVIMYKRLGLTNAQIALYTSWLYLPWVIKPLWSPFIDLIKTKRLWIISTQLLLGAGLAGVALTIPSPHYIQYTLAFFWILAFSSATHDIAADGFYMLSLDGHQQAFFVGVRSMFYRVAMIVGQGFLIMLAGYIEVHSGLPPFTIQVNAVQEQSTKPLVMEDYFTQSGQESVQKISSKISFISIPINQQDTYSVDSMLYLVKKGNFQSGFYGTEIPKLPVKKFNKVSTGNIGVGYFTLTKPPKGYEKIIVSLDRESGDKSISLLEGGRYTFTKDNWDKPAYFIVQLDQKLKYESSAVFQAHAGNIPLAWSITFFAIAGLFIVFFMYHKLVLPVPALDKPALLDSSKIYKEFIRTFVLFFKKENIALTIAFLLIYRFGEAQLIKLASPFLLDVRTAGGLELTTGQVGFVYGTVGIISLTLGGLLGGLITARDGLKKWIWWMFLAINIPHLLYIYLSFALPDSFIIINICVALEQFGYGFGFTAYMLYMLYISEGEYKTAHYAITTGFMALSMMIPGLFSGYLQEFLGYRMFFIWIFLTMIPGYFIVKRLPVESEFGKRKPLKIP